MDNVRIGDKFNQFDESFVVHIRLRTYTICN